MNGTIRSVPREERRNYLDLLLLADPDPAMIDRYLDRQP